MTDLFLKVLDMSITASWVILAVMAVRLLLRKAPKKYSYALWVAALFRLLCPVSLQSVVSAFNFKPFRQAAQSTGELQFIPRDVVIPSVNTEIPAVTTTPPVADAVIDATMPIVDNPPLAAVTPEISVNPMQILLFAGMIIWLVGMAAMVTVSVVNYIRLKKDLQFATRMEGNIWQCETVRSPFLVGLVKPKIYLPYGLDGQTQEYILAHEQYHLKRFDHIAKLLGYAALTLHWFNPLCHLAFRMMNRDMEMSCDEYVLDRNNIPTTQYSYSLLTIATNRRFPAATPLAFAESGVKERMINVLKWKKPKKWVSVVAVLVCVILLISCATNPKVTIPTGDEPAVEDSQAALLEFPGLKWNMTPEEVKNALNLTSDQIVRENKQEADTRSAMPHEGYTIQVQNLSLLGADILNAKFSFVRYEGNDFGLCSVEIYYPEETDMQIVVDEMAEFYGEGTDDPFIDHTFIDGKLTPLIGSGNHTINGKVWAPEKDPDYIRSYWRSTKKGTEVLSADAQSRMADFYAGIEHLQITPEVALELLEKQPMVQVYAVNRNRTAAQYGDKLSGITHNYVRYAADYLVQMIQRFSTNPINQEGQLTPSLLEFPGVKWFVTPDELKQALNITADQILNEATELDRVDTANDYDRYLLTVTDLVLFGRKVTYAFFEFRRDPGYDFEFINAQVMLAEDTDMEKLKEDMVEIYGPGAGENYSYYLYTGNEKTEHTRKSKMDSQLEYFAKSGAHLKGLEGNPFRDVLEDPEYMTHIWVNGNSCDILPEESVEELKTRIHSTNQDAAPDDKELTEMLDQMPLVHVAITNRCATTVYRNVMGTVDEMTPYYTYNYVEFNAASLANYRRIAERKLMTAVPSTEEAFLLEFPGLKWGASVEEVKTALNIQEEQISTDDFQEATNFDTHLLHVKDITFFGEEVSLGCFKFRSVDEENLGLSYIMLFLDEDTDMDRLQETLSYYYRNQGTGEYFTSYSLSTGSAIHVNVDPDELEYKLYEYKRCFDWVLDENGKYQWSGYLGKEQSKPIMEKLNEPGLKTYNWVSSVKPRGMVKSEGLEAMKTLYERNLGIDPSLTDEWLEKRPLVHMSMANRSAQAIRAELEGVTEGELTLATNNIVVLDAQALIELQYEAQRLQKVLESE